MKSLLPSLVIIFLFSTVTLSASSISIQDTKAVSVDEAYTQSMESIKAASTAEEKLAVVQKFLKEFPDSTYTRNMLNTALNLMKETGQSAEDSIAYFVTVRSKVSDPEVGTQLDLGLIMLLAANGKTDEFRDLAQRLLENNLLKFYDCVRVIQYCNEINQFDLIQPFADKAQPFANAESVRADSRNKDRPDEIYEMWGNDRQALLLMVYGMIKTKQGLVDEGLADFAKAESLSLKNIFGLPTDQYPLHLLWGTALMEKGDYREAFNKLAVVGLVMGNPDAYALLRQAYVGFNGGEEGFEAYALSVQRILVPKIENFTLPGYDGQDHSLSELRGKVTVIEFWHPT